MELILGFFMKNFWSVLVTFTGVIAWLVGLQWNSRNNSKRITELEKKLDEDRKNTTDELKELRKEFSHNFEIINGTLQKILFKMAGRDE